MTVGLQALITRIDSSMVAPGKMQNAIYVNVIYKLSIMGKTALRSHASSRKHKQELEHILQFKQIFDPKISNQGNEKPRSSNPSSIFW